jgi:hypothetical protein
MAVKAPGRSVGSSAPSAAECRWLRAQGRARSRATRRPQPSSTDQSLTAAALLAVLQLSEWVTATAVNVPTATAANVPTASAVNVPTASAVNVPTASAVNVPTASAVNVPTASAVNVPTVRWDVAQRSSEHGAPALALRAGCSRLGLPPAHSRNRCGRPPARDRRPRQCWICGVADASCSLRRGAALRAAFRRSSSLRSSGSAGSRPTAANRAHWAAAEHGTCSRHPVADHDGCGTAPDASAWRWRWGRWALRAVTDDGVWRHAMAGAIVAGAQARSASCGDEQSWRGHRASAAPIDRRWPGSARPRSRSLP